MKKLLFLISVAVLTTAAASFAQPPEVIYPNGYGVVGNQLSPQQVLNQGETIAIRFRHDDTPYTTVTIDLVDGGGGVVSNLYIDVLGSPVGPAKYSLPWTVTCNPGHYKIRLAVNGQVDESDRTFEVKTASSTDGESLFKAVPKAEKPAAAALQNASGIPVDIGPPGPDLVVTFGALESDNPAYQGQYILYFAVKNQGEIEVPELWPAAELAITCEKVGGKSCGSWFTGPFRIWELKPGGEQYFASDGLVPLPPPGVRYKFTATADSPNRIDEGAHERNNTVVGFFPPSMVSAFGSVRDQAALLAALEKNIEVGQLHPVDQKAMEKATLNVTSSKARRVEVGGEPSLELVNKRPFYNPKSQVMFSVGDIDRELAIECSSDGVRWSSNCAGLVSMRTIGTGKQQRVIVEPQSPGWYRLRSGAVLSESFEVQAPPRLAAHASAPARTMVKPAVGAGTLAKPKAIGSSAKLMPSGAPIIRLNDASPTAPTLVKLVVQADSSFEVGYVLEKMENGAFRKVASSTRPEFQISEAGQYRVLARYVGGSTDGVVEFSAMSRMKKAVAQPDTAIKQPAVKKQSVRMLKP